MEQIFWVACPRCDGRFYANTHEMRHAQIPLLCPFCRHRFPVEDAAWLDERVERGGEV